MATWSGSVAASADDAAQAPDGTVNLTSATMNANSSVQGGGMRFTNVTIPRYATINSATLTISLNSTSFDDPEVDISCEAVDDATQFAASSNNLSSRTKTTAVRWSATGLGTGTKNTGDFAAALQEVVDRSGWNSGQAINVFVWGTSTSLLRWHQYDNGSGAATLNIDYTDPVSGGLLNQAYYYQQQRAS